MMTLIFAILTMAFALIIKDRRAEALRMFWVAFVLGVLWFNHHVTDSLGLAF